MSDRYDDFRKFEEMMNKMLADFWNMPVKGLLLPGDLSREIEEHRKPYIDLIETDKDIVATADMPGVEKGDIKINLTQDRLEISAEKKHEEEKREKGYIYKERRSGSYYRSVSLSSSIDPDNAKATYNNGVLQITMPKIEIKKKIPLQIE